MARQRISVGFMAGCVCVGILVLGFSVRESLGLRKWRSDFRQEMAQRLDSEEKVARLEKERAALLTDAKDLSRQLERSRADVESLKAAIILEREEKKAYQDRLNLAEKSAPAAIDAVIAHKE